MFNLVRLPTSIVAVRKSSNFVPWAASGRCGGNRAGARGRVTSEDGNPLLPVRWDPRRRKGALRAKTARRVEESLLRLCASLAPVSDELIKAEKKLQRPKMKPIEAIQII